uniref:Phage tail protein (Tail_P2_I) n=1 Tax=Candidatus Kentrum eta TaxID=2126337 RepID=A0A450VHU3_9GAMM|nr:MAG: Phage tail protein (Tail_P2_I) [Candidatus Kentron sp. H]
MLRPRSGPSKRRFASPNVEDAIVGLPGIKLRSPDFLLPWLVWEYGLTEVAPYIGDPGLAIREGLIWRHRRGTTDALECALGWIGISPAIEEETLGAHQAVGSSNLSGHAIFI